MRRLIACLLCLIAAGCSQNVPVPTVAPTASGARVATLQAPFLLSLELPTDTWPAGAPITGVATLALVQGAGADLGGSGGGLLGFDYEEVNGSRHVEPVSTADCAPYRLEAGAPMTAPLSHSGGFSPEQPDFEFYRTFLTAPDVRLPAGDWKISAVASFADGKGCAGAARTIKATIMVHVTP